MTAPATFFEDAVVLLFSAIDVRVDLGLAVDFDNGVGEAVVLFGSVESLFGGCFFELALSGAMILPTERL